MAETEETKLSKLTYAEEQVTRLLEFRFESLALLTKEALTTVNWLFGLMIGSATYALTEMKDNQWWLAIPLGVTCMCSAHEVWRLMRDALQIKNVPSMGNEPDHLLKEEFFNQDEATIRQEHIKSMQGRANNVWSLNRAKGSAINRARKAVVIIPLIAIGLAILIPLIEYAVDYLPCVYRL
jgi:hypothetical protein